MSEWFSHDAQLQKLSCEKLFDLGLLNLIVFRLTSYLNLLH